jgi:hypothetical protein
VVHRWTAGATASGKAQRNVGAKRKEIGQRACGGERVRFELDGWECPKLCRMDINTALARSTAPRTEPNWKRKNSWRKPTLTRGEDSRVPSHGCDEDAW